MAGPFDFEIPQPVGANSIKRVDFTQALGALTVGGKKINVAMPTLKTTDRVIIAPVSDIPLSMNIPTARVPVDGTLELRCTTTVVLGLTDNTAYNWSAIIFSV